MTNNETNFEKLYNKVTSDPAFRDSLAANPEAALQEIGIDPTPEVLDRILQIKKDVEELVKTMGEEVRLAT